MCVEIKNKIILFLALENYFHVIPTCGTDELVFWLLFLWKIFYRIEWEPECVERFGALVIFNKLIRVKNVNKIFSNRKSKLCRLMQEMIPKNKWIIDALSKR